MPTVETRRAAVLKRLLAEGWTLQRHGSGHDIYVDGESQRIISLPRHRTLSPGVARSIAKAAGWL